MPTMKIECSRCCGSGLCKRSSEWGDCAVICNDCAGTGCVELTYEEFKGRKPAQHIKRVFRRVADVGHSHKDAEGIHYSRGGCTYAAWTKGAAPLPVRDLYCPFLWTAEMMKLESHPAHDQYEQMCADHIHALAGRRIAYCPRHQDRNKLAACWRRFDELMNKGEKDE